MKQFILVTIVLLSGCSTKKEAIEENTASSDSSIVSQPGSTPAESTTDFGKMGFPLDSLLRFDSEAALIKAFGDDVKRSVGYYPEEGGEYANTLLFQGTKKEVEFIWLDDSLSFKSLASIKISGQETDWKTKAGITLGTQLKDLEKLNQKPFRFYGFGWDYSGMTSWDNGQLVGSKLRVCLGYPGKTAPPEYEGLMGDQEFRSDSDLAQKANPMVVEVTLIK